MDMENVLRRLRELKPWLRERYKVVEIELFGSFVRGDQRKDSDIDVLVEFDEGADLFDLVGLGLYLEEKLGCHVDVVPKSVLRKELQKSVLSQAVSV